MPFPRAGPCSHPVPRGAPLHREFLEKLGVTAIIQGPGEAYTSLERGLVNAHAYSVLGYAGFGWDKFTKFRIDPSFFQTDVLITMNKKKWDSLSPEAQKILDEVAKEHEKASFAANAENTKKEGDALVANGLKVIELTGEARKKYIEYGPAASWERLTKRDPTNVPALKAKFLD